MTVRELIEKLSELPPETRDILVQVETENEGGDLTEVTAKMGDGKIWWAPDRVILSARY